MKPRTPHFCVNARCGKPCPGFRRLYCSVECQRYVRSRNAAADAAPDRTCLVCHGKIVAPHRSKTCDPKCGAIYDRDARRSRNRRYHHEVRKMGTPGVRRYEDWAADKKPALAQRARARREADPERVREINRRSRDKHRGAALERTREWKARNPERVALHRRRDYARNKARFRKHNLLRGLRKKANATDVGVLELFELRTRFETTCAYCGGTTRGPRNRHFDHVIPLALGGPNTLENLVIACAVCNRDKWHQDPTAWLERMGYATSFKRRFPVVWARLQEWRSDPTLGVFPPREFVTIYEAALAFGVSDRTLRRRIAKGTLSCTRVGNGPNAEICFGLADVHAHTGVRLAWNRDLRSYVLPIPASDSLRRQERKRE